MPPIIVCIGLCVLPNNSLNTFLSASEARFDIEILGTPPRFVNAWPLTASSNVVLLTKKSGTLNIASEGLSILNPLGMSAVFNAFSTHLSASRSLIVLPGLAAA